MFKQLFTSRKKKGASLAEDGSESDFFEERSERLEPEKTKDSALAKKKSAPPSKPAKAAPSKKQAPPPPAPPQGLPDPATPINRAKDRTDAIDKSKTVQVCGIILLSTCLQLWLVIWS
jgi:hypothetical protein